VEIELDPSQPPEVMRAVAELLASRAPGADPWWAAGLEESLEPGDEA
jgi:hypothetical protein